jgi:transcriptional regulator with XRE-family HTH domain
MNRLKKFREMKGRTQFDLGRAIGVQPQKISDFENERRDLRFNEAVKAAKYLGVSLDELAGLKKKALQNQSSR